MAELTQKDEYAKMVCLFLAEGLRTRRVSLKNAADIAGKVLVHLNLLDTEADFLKLVKELAKDFDELLLLERKLVNQQVRSEKKKLEAQVKEFAIKKLTTDPSAALAILEDAAEGDVTAESLAVKYPEFKTYHND